MYILEFYVKDGIFNVVVNVVYMNLILVIVGKIYVFKLVVLDGVLI